MTIVDGVNEDDSLMQEEVNCFSYLKLLSIFDIK